MQIRLIVPPEEEDREESKGTSSEPTFCPFVAHGADATTGVGVGYLTARSSFLVHVVLTNATDNETHRVFIADGMDSFSIPSNINSFLKQIWSIYPVLSIFN